jgi:arabinoxylan arabinofuranohydrolase
MEEKMNNNENDLTQKGKSATDVNPLITNMYCADPTAVVYEGRLYVYGTNDHQQYLHDKNGKNTYEKIKSLVMMSTDDMLNWTYHGIINVEELAPWIMASWAPSIVSRIEADGKTHFYLYYSNSGFGVGVLTATSPTGPWTSPLEKSLIDADHPAVNHKWTPFDPGVVIDKDGVGWMSFGAGEPGTEYMPGGSHIVKLGSDMISLASEVTKIPAPYHFEASELNYINDTYVYTYNTNWKPRTDWTTSGFKAPAPTRCSMVYMTTKTPLDPESWVYRGQYFKNPGDNGFDDSNNHTHLHKYKGEYYLFYHTLELQKNLGVTGGFRSIFVNKAEVNETTLEINEVQASIKVL